MKFSRLAVVATLSSALVLSSCSGGDDPAEESNAPTSSSSAADDAGASSDAAGAGGTADDSGASSDAGDDAAATSGAGDDAAATTTVAMTDDADAAVMPVDDAEKIATDVLGKRFDAFKAKKAASIKKLQKQAYQGSALEAAAAAVKLKDVAGAPAGSKDKKAPVPNVLAISRDDDKKPQFLLVQTVPEDGVPLVHLMESKSGKEKDFRIVWEASMLPGTEIPTFDRRSVGTPVLRKGKGDLVETPRETLKSLAGYISWPQPDETPDYRTHGYSPAVRKAAETQAAAVSGLASLREKNWLVSDDVKTLLFEDGSALVTGTLLRDTTFTVNDGSVLTPPETFTVFADDSELTKEAVLRTRVFVGMRVPSTEKKFKPEMIAAREQLIDAWGS